MDQQDYFYGEVKHNYWKGNLKLFLLYTGYYLSEALILASINPKYDYRSKKSASSNLSACQNKKQFDVHTTQHVLKFQFSRTELVTQ